MVSNGDSDLSTAGGGRVVNKLLVVLLVIVVTLFKLSHALAET